jgi:peptidoglycan/LPS O-acetylase OafA/YrhL
MSNNSTTADSLSTPQWPTRYPELDILRGVAVLLVLGAHLLVIPDTMPFFAGSFFLAWRRIGWIGVDLFFVLSGFLVSGLLFAELQRTRKIRIGRFLIRRGFKIYPSFYVFLSISFLTSQIIQIPPAASAQAFIGEAFFLQNYLGAVWNHTWTLAVEEHFYLLLCLIVTVLVGAQPSAQDPFRFLPRLVAVTACFLLGLRVVISVNHPNGEWESTLTYTHLRIDSLLFGAWLAYLYHFEHPRLVSIVMRYPSTLFALSCFAVLAPLVFPLESSRFMYSVGFTLLYIGFGGVLLLALFFPFRRRELAMTYLAPLGHIGRESYSIYLWHMMVYLVCAQISAIDRSPASFYIHTSLYIGFSLLIGFAAARAVEFPMLRIRDRYFP